MWIRTPGGLLNAAAITVILADTADKPNGNDLHGVYAWDANNESWFVAPAQNREHAESIIDRIATEIEAWEGVVWPAREPVYGILTPEEAEAEIRAIQEEQAARDKDNERLGLIPPAPGREPLFPISDSRYIHSDTSVTERCRACGYPVAAECPHHAAAEVARQAARNVPLTEAQTRAMFMELTITKHSRNLSYGWSMQRIGPREVAQPAAPREEGGTETVRRQMAERQRATAGGTLFTEALFVGGRRIVGAFDTVQGVPTPGEIVGAIERAGWVRVEVQDA